MPAKSEDMHRSLSVRGSRLKDILCHREQRHVSEQLAMSYDRKQIILERSPVSEKLSGQDVELYDFPNRPLEVRSKGVSLPYRIFSKDQRVSHTAIVENKRFGHALALVKAQQELRHEPKVKTNSEKGGYKKRPRQVYGPDFIENRSRQSGGNDGLMESEENKKPFPSLPTLRTAPLRRSFRLTFYPARYRDISIGREQDV